MHPLVHLHSLLVFILLLALGGFSSLLLGLLLLALLYGWRGRAHVRGLLALLRRVRWLLLSILVLYGWWTPGIPLWPVLGGHGPTLEGLSQGGIRAGVLLAIVAAVHWVLNATDRDALLATVVSFARPLRWLGLDHERLAVRMLLTLETVPRVQALAMRIRQAGAGEGSRLGRLASSARHLYGAVLEQADAAEPEMRELPDMPRVPPWQWGVPLLLALLLGSAGWIG